MCISVAARWTLQAPESLSSQGCLSGAFSFRYLSSGAVLSPPRFPHFSLVFLLAHLPCIFSCLRTAPAMDLLRAGSACLSLPGSRAVVNASEQNIKYYLVPKVQRCVDREGQGEQGRALLLPELPAHLTQPPALGSLTLLTTSLCLPPGYSLPSKGTEPGCQSSASDDSSPTGRQM